MKKRITLVNTSPRTMGQTKRKYTRRDLERTAMDMLTFDMDWVDAMDIVDNATDKELIDMIWAMQNA